ncbi:virulence factor [Niabella soli DSM 19437]|uniref:Virulence factor n=1 Tax=Niabella soli DSM 19437 TaxID=929713 RepID=W0F0S3_9BACT|nr:virulence factor [Niabella soli DSM 19437]
MLSATSLFSKAQELPLKTWKGNDRNPLVLYISGDGGFNTFTNGFCASVNKKGYTVTALNSRSYFWSKISPEQAAAAISAYIDDAFKSRAGQQLILLGYSFGGDVSPFIINRLSASAKKHLASVILMDPSTSTDFEIHVSDMWGKPKKRSMDVIAEINKMGNHKTAIILGEDGKDFPLRSVSLKNFRSERLPGGHHFAGNTDGLAATIQKYM